MTWNGGLLMAASSPKTSPTVLSSTLAVRLGGRRCRATPWHPPDRVWVAPDVRDRAAKVAAREGKTILQLAREALEERVAESR